LFCHGIPPKGQECDDLILITAKSSIYSTKPRECVAIEVGQGLRGDDVVAVMERIRQTQQRVPQRLQTDNGLPFESTVFAHKDPAI
jgi:hypothetical protein